MKKSILIIAFCLLSAFLTAQEGRVVILPFTGGEGREGDTIAQLLGPELAKLGNFRIVSRTAAITKIMEEYKFRRGGLTDGDIIVELGKGANAKYVVSGHIQNLDSGKMIFASILDVETFQQIAGGYYEYDQLSEVTAHLPTLAKQLVNKIKKDYSGIPTLAILPVDGVDENNADVLAQLLSIELANREEYVVISRTGAIESVMEKQNIQKSVITDADTIAELGSGVNAEYVVSIHIRNLGSRKIILGSMLHVETFQQVVGDYYEYSSLDEIVNYLPAFAKKLTSKTKKDYSEVPTLSILPFDGVDENNVDVLTQLLAIELANSEKYVVISRIATIESVIKEQNIQRSGITDSDTIAKLGIATNADYILSGSANRFDSDNLMNAQIIDVLTLEQENGSYVEYKTIEDGVTRMFELSYKLTGKGENRIIAEEKRIAKQEREEKNQKFADTQIPKTVLGMSGALVYGPKMITSESNFSGAMNLFGSWGFLPFMFLGGDIGLYFPDDNLIFTSMITTGFNITLFKRLRPYALGGVGGFFSSNQLYDLESKGGFMARAAAGIDILIGNLDGLGCVINLEYSLDFFYNIGFVDRCSLGVGVSF